jgi:hypothetical protein
MGLVPPVKRLSLSARIEEIGYIAKKHGNMAK